MIDDFECDSEFNPDNLKKVELQAAREQHLDTATQLLDVVIESLDYGLPQIDADTFIKRRARG